MRRINTDSLVVILLLVCSLWFSSCASEDNPVNEQNPTTSSISEDYELSPLDVDATFSDVVDGWNYLLGIEIDSLEGVDNPNFYTNVNDNSIDYIRDYSLYLESITRPDSEGVAGFTPEECDYHITRSLIVDRFCLMEFDSAEWAETYYRNCIDDAIDNDEELSCSEHENGFCFVIDEPGSSIRRFYAYYYWANYTMSYCYSFEGSDRLENYQHYIEMCELIGLPTCDQVIDDI